MKQSKKLAVLLAVLAVAVLATVGLSFFKEKTEQIQNSGETVLEISPDTVTALSWEYDGESLSFHRDGRWLWDGDEAFPVDQEKVADFLSRFEDFTAAFVIENVEDFGQYGLEKPLCTVRLTAGDRELTLTLGDFSQMDGKRYVSIGDGNVYLVNEDPLDDYDAVLSDMIQHDELPSFEKPSSVRFSGAENYEIFYEEDSGNSLCEDDVYFTRRDGGLLPLDSSLVNGYLANITLLDAKDYVTYNATEEELASYGLDAPELTVAVDYTADGEDGEEQEESFTLHISRDPAEAAQAAETAGDDESGEAAEDSENAESEEEEITAYVRVGDSPIVYKIDGGSYRQLMAASLDDLRHKELLTADFDAVTGIDVSLEGKSYALSAQTEGDETSWFYGEEELEVDALRAALTALSAEEFSAETPSDKQEIGLILHLDSENFPTLRINLYRYDGTRCLAEVDGAPVALIPRSQAVDLIEAVHAIVLS